MKGHKERLKELLIGEPQSLEFLEQYAESIEQHENQMKSDIDGMSPELLDKIYKRIKFEKDKGRVPRITNLKHINGRCEIQILISDIVG